MPGYVSLPLPIGVGIPKGTIGKGNGPLPIQLGVPKGTIGKGYGPLPFLMGIGGAVGGHAAQERTDVDDILTWISIITPIIDRSRIN